MSANPNSQPKKSGWGSLSIRDRIQAMNKTLDLVEEKHAVAPRSDLLLRFSSSEETFPSSGSEVKPEDNHSRPPARSSVIDIWRSRENASPKIEPTKAPSKPDPVKLNVPITKVSAIDGEEKKESESDKAQSNTTRQTWGQEPSEHATKGQGTATADSTRMSPSAGFSNASAISRAKDPLVTEPTKPRASALWEYHRVQGSHDSLGKTMSQSHEESETTKRRYQTAITTPPLPDKRTFSDIRPVSRTGSASPDTGLSVGSSDGKLSRVTDFWEKRSSQSSVDRSAKDSDERSPFLMSKADRTELRNQPNSSVEWNTRELTLRSGLSDNKAEASRQTNVASLSVGDKWKQKQKPFDDSEEHRAEQEPKRKAPLTKLLWTDAGARAVQNPSRSEPASVKDVWKDKSIDRRQGSVVDRWNHRPSSSGDKEGCVAKETSLDDSFTASTINSRLTAETGNRTSETQSQDEIPRNPEDVAAPCGIGGRARRNSLTAQWEQIVNRSKSSPTVEGDPTYVEHNHLRKNSAELIPDGRLVAIAEMQKKGTGSERRVVSATPAEPNATIRKETPSSDESKHKSSSFRCVSERWAKAADELSSGERNLPWASNRNASLNSIQAANDRQSNRSDENPDAASVIKPATNRLSGGGQNTKAFSLRKYTPRAYEKRSEVFTKPSTKLGHEVSAKHAPSTLQPSSTSSDPYSRSTETWGSPKESRRNFFSTPLMEASCHEPSSSQGCSTQMSDAQLMANKLMRSSNSGSKEMADKPEPQAHGPQIGVTLNSEEGDENSDETPKPSKIIQSWTDRVYQTDNVPSSPRFSKQPPCDKECNDPASSARQTSVRDSPKASPGSSQASAFNAWNGSSKVRPKRDFVSLGKRHIVQGFANTKANGDGQIIRRKETKSSNDYSNSDHGIPLSSSARYANGGASQIHPKRIQEDATTEGTENSTEDSSVQQDDAIPTSGSIVPPSTFLSGKAVQPASVKLPAPRLHLPSPMIRRKKKLILKVSPSVTPNLSDIIEVHSEDTAGSEPLSPRSREVTHKKKGLQAQRRKMKAGVDVETRPTNLESPSPKSKEAPIARGHVLDELVQIIDQGSTSDGYALAVQTPQSGANGSFEENRLPTPEPEHQKESNQVLDVCPRSPQISEAEFSFFSDNHSVHSGMTSILSGGSLTNRAEKLLTERRREQRKACASSAGNRSANGQGIRSINPHDNSLSRQVMETSPSLRSSDPSSESSHLHSFDRPRLETRYNTASRFLDAAQSKPVSKSVNQGLASASRRGSTKQSFTAESSGSSFQSVGSGTDESDTNDRKSKKSRRKPKKKAHKRRNGRRKTVSPQAGIASEKFLAEHAAHFNAFKSACKRFTLRDIASDWAGEIKMLGFDTTSFAASVNQKIALCVNETKKARSCHEFMDFDEEDVAIEVEFMEDDLEEDDSNSIEDDDSTIDDPIETKPQTMGMMCTPLGGDANRAQM